MCKHGDVVRAIGSVTYTYTMNRCGEKCYTEYCTRNVLCKERTVHCITLLTPPVHCICIRHRSYGSHDISVFAHVSKYR